MGDLHLVLIFAHLFVFLQFRDQSHNILCDDIGVVIYEFSIAP